jgi:hypothetical protein
MSQKVPEAKSETLSYRAEENYPNFAVAPYVSIGLKLFFPQE